MLRKLTSFCAVLALSLVPLAASAQDWATSIYSAGGAEIRADERIFTLFAALNELGHDDAPITREFPVPKREFFPLRQQVRDVVGIAPALRAKFEKFFDEHPLPLQQYITYTLALGDAPKFALPEGAKPPAGTESLKGLEALLAEFYTAARIKEIFAQATQVQRDALREFSAVVDAPIASTREVLKMEETDDSPQIVVIVNLLDGRGAAYGATLGEETYLVVGPGSGGEIDPAPIARAFARANLQPLASGKGAALKNGTELLREVRAGYGMNTDNLDDYIIESFARVVAIRAALSGDAATAAMNAEMRQGYLLARELNRGLAIFARATKPLDAFLADFLREIDVGSLPRP